MDKRHYAHSIDVENDEYSLYFATNDEELFMKMQMFIGTNCREWWV